MQSPDESRRTNPNADLFGEDGWRLYSAYDGAAQFPVRHVWAKRIRLAAIILAFVAGALAVIVITALPH